MKGSQGKRETCLEQRIAVCVIGECQIEGHALLVGPAKSNRVSLCHWVKGRDMECLGKLDRVPRDQGICRQDIAMDFVPRRIGDL